MTVMSLTDDVKHKALELGFDLVGVTDASPLNPKETRFLEDWLKAGYAAQMHYMHRNLEGRINPAAVLEDAQSVIVVGLNYKPSQSSSLQASRNDVKQSHLNPPECAAGRIATYAQYEDYHPFIRTRLRSLADFVSSVAPGNHKFKICVDSDPLAERALAVRAGLGFIGKNRMLINPTLGPQIFLGEIVTTLKLEPDQPFANNCPDCDKCIAACPTGALRSDGQFDANKCISYLTIEYKGQIASNLSENIGEHLFGCDDCVLACPYQQNAPPRKNKEFKLYADRARLNLNDVPALTDDTFKGKFADSVIKRLGLAGLKRNAQICSANIALRFC